jgi:prepilin-type N-terminal cleavage/methylation domain-containing protein
MRLILQFKNKKGFSLPELLAVMAIMAILAATSSPFIRGYIKDAANDKAKAMLQLVAQAYKTFKADYPNATFTNASVNSSASVACTVAATDNSPGVLKGCRYLQNINWAAYKYNFYVGASCCTSAPGTPLACMSGTADTGDYTNAYCAWVDELGTLDDNKD